MPVAEITAHYKERPEGSYSKLSTYRDGFRILKTILRHAKEERPFLFFTVIFAGLAALAAGLAFPLFLTYLETGLVPRLPTAVLCSGVMLLAFLSLTCGIILESLTRSRREMKRLKYLELAPPRTLFRPARLAP